MEPFGGTGSIIAVVSLTVQLAESAKKLYGFWKLVDEAPDFVHEIVADLKLLSTALAEIALHEQNHGSNGSVTDILESCTKKTQSILALTTKLELDLQSTSRRKRKWSAIRAVFKEDKIEKFQQRLSSMKSNLILAQQTLSNRRIQVCFDQNGQILAAMSQRMDKLCEQNKQVFESPFTLEKASRASPEENLEKVLEQAASHITNPYIRSGFKRALEIAIKQTTDDFEGNPISECDSWTRKPVNRQRHEWISSSSSTTKTLFGDITIRANTYVAKILTDQGYEDLDHLNQNKIRVIFRPSAFLVRFGLAYELQLGLIRSPQTWRTTFQVFQPVPDNSPIFEFCRVGNIEGMQMLFSTKQASVWDTDSMGFTPLHVAAGMYQPQAIQLLLSEGADRDTVTYSQRSCLDVLIVGDGPRSTIHRSDTYEIDDLFIHTLSFFTDQFDELRIDQTHHCGLYDCGYFGGCVFHFLNVETSTRLAKKLVQSHHSLLYTSEEFALFFWILCTYNTPTIEWAANTFKDNLDVQIKANRFSPFLLFIIWDDWDAVKSFAKHGADLHLVGKDTNYSPVEETATSLSLYSSRLFFEWTSILRDLETDIKTFIDDELQCTRLRQDGWQNETLKVLFELEFSPKDDHGGCENSDCEHGEDMQVMVDVCWQSLLERIKHEESLDGYIDRYSKRQRFEPDIQQRYFFVHRIADISDDADLIIRKIAVGGVNFIADNSETPKEGGSDKDVPDSNEDDNQGSSWRAGISQDGSSWEGEQEAKSTEWFCVHCWHKKHGMRRAPSMSSSLAAASEADSDEEESPMLLKIDL